MFMLNILLFILLAFLYLLGFLLFIIVVILVSPIKYRIIVVKKDDLIIDVDSSWLFRLVVFSFRRYKDKKNQLTLKAFGKTLIGKKKKKSKKAKTTQKPENKDTQANQPVTKQLENPVSEAIPKPDTEKEPKVEKKKSKKTVPDDLPETDTETDNEEENNTGKRDMLNKILKFPYKGLLVNKTIILLKRLIRAIKPNKFTLQTVFGTGDPNTTGLILGALFSVFGAFNCNLNAAGDFEKARLDLDLYIKGRFTLGYLLFVLFLYVISKPVWEIIRIYSGKSKLV